MFCFDKAYSLKCLAADKQGSFCGTGCSSPGSARASMHTRARLPGSHPAQMARHPVLVIINLTHHENKTGSSGPTGCYVCEGIYTSQPPKICQRLPTAFRMNSTPLSRLTGPGSTLPAHTPALAIHTHSPTRRLVSPGRFSNTACSVSSPALPFCLSPAWLLATALSEPSRNASSSRELPDLHCSAPAPPTQTNLRYSSLPLALGFLVRSPCRP